MIWVDKLAQVLMLAVMFLASQSTYAEESMLHSLFGSDQQAGPADALDPANTRGDSDVLPEEAPPAIEISPQGPTTARMPWHKPDFSGQADALGYTESAFAAPEGFRERIDFWISIYSKYTTDQGLMHDSIYLGVVYEPVDFNSIKNDRSLNPVRKRHARERLIKERRKVIEERLLRLQKLTSPEGLAGEDLRVWKMFEKIPGTNKFAEATRKGRIRFQLGQKDRFALGIYYSGRYLPAMEKVFREEKLPIELTRLPFVESSFNIYARSRVGASGIWQFMRRTARPYMMVNSAVDERNDPIKATRSAAKLLHSNFDLLKSWPLALTGYNHGPNGVLRISRKLGTTDIVKIVDSYSSRHFGFASENFFACFLAALEVERNAHKYFGDVKWSVPLDHAEVHLDKAVPYEAVKVWFGGDDELAQLYNPHFSSGVRRGRQNMPRGTNVRIPPGTQMFATQYLEGKLSLADMKKGMLRTQTQNALPPGITSTGIPALTPTPVPAPIAAGPIAAPTATPLASALPVSVTPVATTAALPNATPAAPPAERETYKYKTVRGDTLDSVAKNFGVTSVQLQEANRSLHLSRRLRAGEWLTVPAVALTAAPAVTPVAHGVKSRSIAPPPSPTPEEFTLAPSTMGLAPAPTPSPTPSVKPTPPMSTVPTQTTNPSSF